MIEVAEVFRRFAADYLNAHGAAMPPSHRRAIEDILACRTAALGGQVWCCDTCGAETFSFHPRGNRRRCRMRSKPRSRLIPPRAAR
ncbi:MAG TPA: transposase zinc-binding domain-containing protein [Polyangia bacterium]